MSDATRSVLHEVMVRSGAIILLYEKTDGILFAGTTNRLDS